MSKRWLGLLLVLLWIGGAGVARAAATVTPGSPTIEFGPVTVGQSSAAMSEALTTTEAVTVTIAGEPGRDCGQFAASATSIGLNPGNGATILITFSPTSTGAKTCTFDVQQGGTTLAKFTASGTSVDPAVIITPDANPLDFGTVDVGFLSTALNVTIKNNRADVLTATASIVTHAANFPIAAPANLTLDPGELKSWNIKCQPTTPGAISDTFHITFSDAIHSPIDIPITCSGGDLGKLSVDKTTLAFDGVSVNASKDLVVTLTNTGNFPVSGITATLAPLDKGYSISPLAKTTLASGEATMVTVTFAPQAFDDGGPATLTFNGTWKGHPTSATSNITGQTIALAVSVPKIDLGSFRFDAAQTATFDILNNGTADLQISPPSYVADAGTPVPSFTFSATPDGNNPFAFTTPQTIPGKQKLTVTATSTLTKMAGMLSGKLIVQSSTASTVKQTITFTGNAEAALAKVDGVDFGGVDVASAATMLKASIKNTGNAPLDITKLMVTGSSPAFTVEDVEAQSIAPGATLPINVSYKPTVVRAAGNPESVTLTTTLTGQVDGPVPATITVVGHGIGRDLAISDVPTAPVTFRNPGATAPVIPVTISNRGEAVLHITAAMTTGDPVWTLVDGGPVDVAGGSTHDFMVKFAPDAIGPAPTGQLVLTSLDDKNQPQTAMVDLTGAGEARNVAFGSQIIDPAQPMPVIDVGVAGVNLPITAEDLLQIINRDPGNRFTVHEIGLEGDNAFTIENAPKDQALAASATQAYSVTFSPTRSGELTAIATLYLDQDPVPHAQVMLKGEADLVEAHGGGGCNSSGTGAGGGSLVLGLAALGVIRRRRQPASQAVAS